MGKKRKQKRSASSGSPGPAAPPPSGSPRWRWHARRDGAAVLLVFLATFGAFANSIGNDFVYDDVGVILEDPRRDTPWDLETFFTTTYWSQESRGLYRPLTIWSFALDRTLFGPGPLPVHLVNVLAGSVLGVLVYVFLALLLARRELALAAALLFSLHPVHTEVMANGVGRSEIMSGLFLVLAAIVHVRGTAERGRRGGGAPGATLASLLYLAAILFKESAAVLPALLFLADWLLVNRGRIRGVLPGWWRYAGYALVLALYVPLRISVTGTAPPPIQEVMMGLSTGERMLYAGKTMLDYLGQLLVPWRLLADYSDYLEPVTETVRRPGYFLWQGIWIVLAAGVAFLVRRRMLEPVFGLAWFLVAILPASNLLFPIGTVRADRLLFLPSLGFAVALGWLLVQLGARRREVGWGLLALVLCFYSWRTVTRNRDWRTQEALWTADLPKLPGSAIGWALIGDVHRDRGELDPAEAAYLKSIELRDRIGFYAESHNNYAAIMNEKGNREEAKKHYRLVISRKPDQFTALVNLGAMLLKADSTRAEAIACLEQAVRVKPDDPAARVNLAQAHKLAGNHPRALAEIEAALALRPRKPEFWAVKADILFRAGRRRESEEAMREAARLRDAGG